MRRKCRGHLAFFLVLAAIEFGSHAWSACVALGTIARCRSKIARQQAARDLSPISLLPPKEVGRINAAVRSKALEAIAIGNLPPGKELELISALDLGTIPWNQLPVQLKEKLSLPLEDRGIDSLSLNLSVAVQAKDYANGSTIPLSRLSTFHLLVEGKFSKLKGQVEEMIVATSEGAQLPKLWHLSGATHRTYDADEAETWRKIAQEASMGEEKQSTTLKRDALKRWPHQKECLKQCRNFLQNKSTLAKRDFFVQMATGTGKSLVMADLLASISSSPKRACVIVPKLDLMEQMAQLLEEMCPSSQICRVGTRWPANLTADIFVCVRNSASQVANLTFDLVLFDEAHHYEPLPQMLEKSGNATATNGQANEALHPRTRTQQVLALNARRRIFFSATLRQNLPDFDFGLRPAIEAGVIQDYSVMVPVLSEGDPRPGLVKLILNLPLSRKILAFCNTVQEAQAFTRMLVEAGIAADHYNGGTASMRRQEILQTFERSEIHGGIRVLVTVDVLSEGVDLPVADTCLFVAPRRDVRLRQCVGRVLRKHHAKVDALVVAPPIVKTANDSLVEESELLRLLSELATADPWFEKTLDVGDHVQSRIGISTAGLLADEHYVSVGEMVGEVLEVRVLPYVLDYCKVRSAWDRAYQELVAYKGEHGHVLVPALYRTLAGFGLGPWVCLQRRAKKSNLLSCQQIARMDTLGFAWNVLEFTWMLNLQRLESYLEKHGHVLVPRMYVAPDGFKLGNWVSSQRVAKSRGKLSKEQIARLDEHGFVWDAIQFAWDSAMRRLQAYKAEHGHVLVPKRYVAPDGFKLGSWVNIQRVAKSRGKLSKEQIAKLDENGFVWDAVQFAWDSAVRQLQAYKAQHGHVLVHSKYVAPNGFKLGNWVGSQRVAKSRGKLSKEQIAKLDEHGFIWDALQFAWDSAVRQLQAYKAEHGHVLVPARYVAPDGFKLGNWVSNYRAAKSRGKLGEEQIAKLDEHGFVWDAVQCGWDSAVRQLQAYKAQHGHVLVHARYVAPDGFKLGNWVYKQRAAKSRGNLSKEQIAKLDEHGFVWDAVQFAWDSAVRQLQAYKAQHGHVLVPARYVAPDGFKLGNWVSNHRAAKSRGKLSKEQIAKLDEHGFVWDAVQCGWDSAVRQLQAYKAQHGHVLVHSKYVAPDGFKLGRWVYQQRAAKSRGKLSKEQIAKLDGVCS